MSISVDTISNFSLDVSSVSSLAMELAKRFNVNIKLTGYLSEELNLLLHGIDKWESVIYDEVILNPGFTTLEMINDNYNYSEILKASLNKGLLLPKEIIKTAEKAIQSKEFSIEWPSDNENFMSFIYFYDHVAFLTTDFYMGWWQYIQYLNLEHYYDEAEEEEILKMRKALYKYSTLIGASHVYQLSENYAYWNKDTEDIKNNWEKLDAAVSEYPNVILLSKYFSDVEYRKQIYRFNPFHPIIKDDFKDLKPELT